MERSAQRKEKIELISFCGSNLAGPKQLRQLRSEIQHRRDWDLVP